MRVSGQKMSMIRGDTESFTVSIQNEAGEKIALQNGDKIYFTVKTSPKVEEKILQKLIESFNDGNAEIFIEHNDTKDLPTGDYVYDIQWTKADESVTTIIPPNVFEIAEEVTYE